MKKNIKITNEEIYILNTNLINLIQQNLSFPIKVSFFLEKNNKILNELALQIENQRQVICRNYGILDKEKNIYRIKDEDIEKVNKELKDLLNIEQEVTINQVSLKDFGDINITFQQMQALSFMIEEEDD